MTVEEIAELADEAGYEFRYVTNFRDEAMLNVYSGGILLWQWVPYSEEAGDFNEREPEDRDILEAYKPAAVYDVEHHYNSHPQLAAFLEQVLERYGGYVEFEGGYGRGDLKDVSFRRIFSVKDIGDLATWQDISG